MEVGIRVNYMKKCTEITTQGTEKYYKNKKFLNPPLPEVVISVRVCICKSVRFVVNPPIVSLVPIFAQIL